MALQNFKDGVGPVMASSWLNNVDAMVNTALGGVPTVPAVQAALGIPGGGVPISANGVGIVINAGADTGAANAYVFAVPAGTMGTPAALAVGQILTAVFGTANTGPSTINVGGTGVVALVDQLGNALTFGEIVTSDIYLLKFNGVSWQIVGQNMPIAKTPGEIAAAVTIANAMIAPLVYDRYKVNTVPGTTDMTTAIKAAVNVAKAQGGGVISGIPGSTYAMSGLDPASPINLPSQNSDGSIGTSSTQIQVYCLGCSNITFDFSGITLKSTITGGGVGFLLDNCTNIVMRSPNFTGTQVQGGGIAALGPVTGGAGYTNGVYLNVPLNGGTGHNAFGTFTVAGGAVSSVVITYPGGSTTASLAQGYQVTDTLTVSNAFLGGAGAGFSVQPTSVLGAGNIVSVASILPVCVTSTSGLSSGITIYDLTATKCFLGFACIDGLNANGIVSNNILLLGRTVINGPGLGASEYGIALQNGGDNTFIADLYTFQVNRPFFFYGVDNVVIANMDAQQTNYAFGSIIKSYSRSTRNISINGSHRNAPGNTAPRVSIQVQCDPAVITPPPTVKKIDYNCDEFNQPASTGIEFDYFAGAGGTVQTATSANQLFDQVTLRGICLGFVLSNVKFTTTAAQCAINYDNLESAWSTIYGGATDIRNGLGFISSRMFFCTIALTFGGVTVAGTGGAVEAFIFDGMCRVKGTITLTAKNGAGQAAVTLPFTSRADDTTQSLGQTLGVANMAGLGGPMVGALAPNSNSMLLYTQAAAAAQSVLDTNFTITSSFYFDVSYPI